MNIESILERRVVKYLRVLTSHGLAKDLLRKGDKFLTASYGEDTYIIDGYRQVLTDANSDDSIMNIDLILRKADKNA